MFLLPARSGPHAGLCSKFYIERVGSPSLQWSRWHGVASNELAVFIAAFRPFHPLTSKANIVSLVPAWLVLSVAPHRLSCGCSSMLIAARLMYNRYAHEVQNTVWTLCVAEIAHGGLND